MPSKVSDVFEVKVTMTYYVEADTTTEAIAKISLRRAGDDPFEGASPLSTYSARKVIAE